MKRILSAARTRLFAPLALIALVVTLAGASAHAGTAGLPTPSLRTLMPAGTMVSAGDFPAAAVLSSDRSTIYVSDAGQTTNYVNAFKTTTMAATFVAPAMVGGSASPTAQSGSIVLSPNGATLYIGGGTTNDIGAFTTGAALTQATTYTVGSYVGGVAVSRHTRYLFAAEPFNANRGYQKGNTLARVDTTTRAVMTTTVGQTPFALADGVIRRGHREVVAVANRDDGALSIVDALTLTTIKTVPVGRQPVMLTFVDGGTHLLVLDTLDDELVDVETATWRVAGRVNLSGPKGVGAGPSAFTVSRDGHSVYVALSGDNAVGVVQRGGGGRNAARPGAMKLIGRIPTADYPSAVALDETVGKLYVTCAKGIYNPVQSPPGPGVPVPPTPTTDRGPSGTGVSGVLETIPLPASHALLDAYSAQVAAADLWNTSTPVSTIPSAITHVIYIIRENKTYDEEFGDEPGGSPAGLIYGRPITPNAHALADRFGLLQSFYGDEEVSDTGHQIVMGSVSNDWVERISQQAYGIDAGPFQDAEDGKAADTLWGPSNYLLDDAAAHGVAFKDYGEFYRQSQSKNGPGATPTLEFGPALTPALDSGVVHTAPGFGFDLNTKDTVRAAYWKTQFQNDVTNDTVPPLQVIYLPTDHTSSGAAGRLPQDEVSDNDRATGVILDTLSHSSYWGSTAVFIAEDDTQSGIDHIDKHRNIGLVVSPYVKAGAVTTHYDQAGMLRTIEEILGLPPLTEFDATSPPMDALFNQTTPDLTPYTAISPTVPAVTTLVKSEVSRLAVHLLGKHPNLSAPDQLPSWATFQVQWLAVHGKYFTTANGPSWLHGLSTMARPAIIAHPSSYLWSRLIHMPAPPSLCPAAQNHRCKQRCPVRANPSPLQHSARRASAVAATAACDTVAVNA